MIAKVGEWESKLEREIEMRSETKKGLRIFRWCYGLMGGFALAASYLFMMNGVHHEYGPIRAAGSVFRLFTNQSNLLVVVWVFAELMRTHNNRKNTQKTVAYSFFRGGLTVYIFMTFLVYHIFLRHAYLVEGPNAIINIITHYVIPAAYILDWYWTEERQIYRMKYVLFWMVYPSLYTLVGIVYGKITGTFPYEYLNWELESFGYIILYGIMALMIFVIAGIVCVLVNQQTLRTCSKKNTSHGDPLN